MRYAPKKRTAWHVWRPFGEGRPHVCRKSDFDLHPARGGSPVLIGWKVKLTVFSSSGLVAHRGLNRFVQVLTF